MRAVTVSQERMGSSTVLNATVCGTKEKEREKRDDGYPLLFFTRLAVPLIMRNLELRVPQHGAISHGTWCDARCPCGGGDTIDIFSFEKNQQISSSSIVELHCSLGFHRTSTAQPPIRASRAVRSLPPVCPTVPTARVQYYCYFVMTVWGEGRRV